MMDINTDYFKNKVNEQLQKAFGLYLINRSEIKMSLMKVTGRHFVYLLEKNKKVVYVGRSKNLYSRLVSHKSKKDFDKVYLIEYTERAQSVDAEYYFIKHHKPILNKLWVEYG